MLKILSIFISLLFFPVFLNAEAQADTCPPGYLHIYNRVSGNFECTCGKTGILRSPGHAVRLGSCQYPSIGYNDMGNWAFGSSALWNQMYPALWYDANDLHYDKYTFPYDSERVTLWVNKANYGSNSTHGYCRSSNPLNCPVINYEGGPDLTAFQYQESNDAPIIDFWNSAGMYIPNTSSFLGTGHVSYSFFAAFEPVAARSGTHTYEPILILNDTFSVDRYIGVMEFGYSRYNNAYKAYIHPYPELTNILTAYQPPYDSALVTMYYNTGIDREGGFKNTNQYTSSNRYLINHSNSYQSNLGYYSTGYISTLTINEIYYFNYYFSDVNYNKFQQYMMVKWGMDLTNLNGNFYTNYW